MDDEDYIVRFDKCEALRKVAGFKLAKVVKQAKAWWAARTEEKKE